MVQVNTLEGGSIYSTSILFPISFSWAIYGLACTGTVHHVGYAIVVGWCISKGLPYPMGFYQGYSRPIFPRAIYH